MWARSARNGQIGGVVACESHHRQMQRQLRAAVAGLAGGLLAGVLARSQSQRYGPQESSALRVTAHATIPFFVVASTLTNRVSAGAALPFRAGFIGAHLVHVREIARLLQEHDISDPMIRAELAGGVPLYGLLALQTALVSGAGQQTIGPARARRLTRRIDAQLLRIYCVAVTSGLLRYRRPLPVYASLATLLAGCVTARRSL